MARIGIIVDDMVEESELRVPLKRLEQAGHEVVLLGLERGKRLMGRHGGETFVVDLGVGDMDATATDALDALVIPGGFAADTLRADPRVVDLVRDIYDAGKPLAAMEHGVWLLADADIAAGLTLTSCPSIRTDLVNAGADWVDEAIVEHDNILTAQGPADLPVFCDVLLRLIDEATAERDALEVGVSAGPGARARWKPAPSGGPLETEAWHGGEGEGRPETRDIGGLQQRERFLVDDTGRAPADNEALDDGEQPASVGHRSWRSGGAPVSGGPGEAMSEEQWLSGREAESMAAEVDMHADLHALVIDAGVEAGATSGPHGEERITLEDVEAQRRARASAAPPSRPIEPHARSSERAQPRPGTDTLDGIEGAP